MRTLLRALLIIGFLVIFPVVSSFAKTPEKAYKQIVEFAKNDNWEAFFDGFDSDSQKVHLSSLPFLPFYVFGDGDVPAGFYSLSPREQIIAIYRKMGEPSKDPGQEAREEMMAAGHPGFNEQESKEVSGPQGSPQDYKLNAGEVKSAKINGKIAKLTVINPAGQENEVLMKLEKGVWKIHLKEVEESPELVRIGAAIEKGDQKAAEEELNKMMNIN